MPSSIAGAPTTSAAGATGRPAAGRPSVRRCRADGRSARRSDGEPARSGSAASRCRASTSAASGGSDWFATRDGGYLDADGFLFIEGRLDDVIVRGGENISPGEIEEVLREHAAVDDVAVYAIPSQEWGEDIGASVVLVGDVDPDELREWVRPACARRACRR